MSAVIDASAFLAMMLDERGGDVVIGIARGCAMSSVNFCEAMTKAIDEGHSSDEVRKLTDRLEIAVVPFDAAQAQRAADLRPSTRVIGASLGDRACLALAQMTGKPVYSADHDWAKLSIDIDIRMIRTRNA